MRTKANNQNKFVRFVTIPYRVLIKAKDFYVRSITECSVSVNYGNMAGGSAAGMPRSYSVSSSRSNDGEDMRELIRAASAKSIMGGRVDMNALLQQHMTQSMAVAGLKGVPRSCSVGMGKIDEEEEPCDFGGEENKVLHGNGRKEKYLLYPRSKSYAVVTKPTSVVF